MTVYIHPNDSDVDQLLRLEQAHELTTSTPTTPTIPWRRLAVISALLALPVLVPVVAHYSNAGHPDRELATGMVIYDSAYYLANARDHWDAGGFRLTYGNPFSETADTPKIYFQPLVLLMGLLLWLFPAYPGIISTAVCYLLASGAMYVMIRCFESRFSLASLSHRLTLLCLLWGGGIYEMCTMIIRPFDPWVAEKLTRIEPAGGWWTLCLGRSLCLPTEALYHLIVFSIFLCIIRKRMRLCIGLIALLSISHPFSGVQFAMILATWGFAELVIFKNIPR